MDPFLYKWFLSLVVGSTWITLSTIIAEKVSGKLGGLIAGLPSTAVVSLLFIGFTQGTDAAVRASLIVPFSSGLYCFFFISYLILSKKGFKQALFGSLAVWFSFAIIASFFKPQSMFISIILWLLLISSCILWTVKNIDIKEKQIPKKITSSSVWFKAILSGIVISSVVLLSKVAGPTWGGIFATFPALTISAFLITVKSGGVEFTRLLAKNILISTTTTIGLFAILTYLLYPLIGIWLGTVISYLALLLISLPLYYFVFEKLKNDY
ncbi:DUF3147 family protein [Patescibacteria group bacterium]|nr:DUF3147 family protein [Patescibacteria group bacterium]